MPVAAVKKANPKNKIFFFAVIVLAIAIIVLFTNAIIKISSQGGTSAGGTAVKSLSGGFSCTVDLNSGGKDYEVSVNKTAGGDFKMTFVKPTNLSSLSFEKSDDGLKVKFGTLEAAVDASSIPQSSLYNAVINTFDECSKAGVKAQKQGNDLVLSGSSKSGEFTLTLDSGLKPKSLSVPSLKLNAQFKDFKFT
ncbi:MAG TPA: hypothetical protein VHO66_06410 [Ruminiclostridium sp.]|nr:hypothetical protein [Ruminiclostridium sp.]